LDRKRAVFEGTAAGRFQVELFFDTFILVWVKLEGNLLVGEAGLMEMDGASIDADDVRFIVLLDRSELSLLPLPLECPRINSRLALPSGPPACNNSDLFVGCVVK
jgi:hypothetical protein